MSESAGVGAQRATPTTTVPTPVVGDTALEHRPIWSEALAHSHEPEFIKAAERGQVARAEGSVEQVEVLQMVSVRTSILGDLDPRPQSLTPRSAHPQL